jgi:hypothetical protein
VLGPALVPSLGVELVAGVEVGVGLPGSDPVAVEPLCVEPVVAGVLESDVAGVVFASVLCAVASVLCVAVSVAGVVGSAAGVVVPAEDALESELGVVAAVGDVVGSAGVCAEASVDGAPVAAGAESRTERGASAAVDGTRSVPLWAGPAGT